MPDSTERIGNSPYLTTGEAGDFLRLKRNTLEKMRRQGRGPRFRKHGRRVLYLIDDLEAWSTQNASLFDPDPDVSDGTGAEEQALDRVAES